MERQNISSGAPWEKIAAYSRAVRVGPMIWVSGTTATNAEGQIVGVGDPYLQAVQTLHNIRSALQQAGADLRHVVKTRIYVTRMTDWQEVSRAHRECFSEVMPACLLVEVPRLVSPDMLVEIEAEAMIFDE